MTVARVRTALALLVVAGLAAAPAGARAAGEWTTEDVLDARVEVDAQYALMRMFGGAPGHRALASWILDSVKAGDLAGIYRIDRQAPALRAKRMGKGYWDLLPRGATAMCLREPAGEKPMVVLTMKALGPSALDAALAAAWSDCRLKGREVRGYRVTITRPVPRDQGCPVPARESGVNVVLLGGAAGTAIVDLVGPARHDVAAVRAPGAASFRADPGPHTLIVFVPGADQATRRTVEVRERCQHQEVVILRAGGGARPPCASAEARALVAACDRGLGAGSEACWKSLRNTEQRCGGEELCATRAAAAHSACMARVGEARRSCLQDVVVRLGCVPGT